LQREQRKLQQIVESLPQREIGLPGGIAMAGAFATYLGPYHFSFRRVMLTVHWPNCLRERGIPLVVDSIDEIKGSFFIFFCLLAL
jgi:dynein heavy chain